MGRVLRIAAALAAAIAAVAIAGVPLYVLPARDEPRAVDAVYVIGPPYDPRIEFAEGMIEDGLAGALVVSIIDEPVQRAALPEAADACDGAPRAYPVHCSQPDPFTTRGEARWLSDLATEHGWDSVAVITTTPHITRTRVIMERCWDGEISYLDSGEPLGLAAWAYQYAYQSAAFVKVAWEQGC
ncbi:YdcF family protein [Demequina sp.]|uniref:YdcF family protein n=1 Tax=Demequina sp. TaxID=2050685 RepID=UPI0025F040A7|nr:YdcF family protein [Demequina sp.]